MNVEAHEGRKLEAPRALIEPAAVNAFLHGEIPLTRAMGMAVTAWDGQAVTLTAPLEPNLNHADTAFGGSIASMGIMAGYCLAYLILAERKISNRLLIQQSSVEFLRPIDGEMTARACVPADVAAFVELLEKKRRARLTLTAAVSCKGLLAARHTGVYVAMVY
jgi:thioesterase domain-containing protein